MSSESITWAAQQVGHLRPTTLVVVMAMADLADESGVLRANLDAICAGAGVSRATVKRVIAKLVHSQMVYREVRREDGVRLPNLTVLAPIEPQRAREPMWSIPSGLLPEDLTPEDDYA